MIGQRRRGGNRYKERVDSRLGVTNTVGLGVQTDGIEALLSGIPRFTLGHHGCWGQDKVTISQEEVRY